MEIGKTLAVFDRSKWRKWLEENYNKATDIWLIYYNKRSGKTGISYDDAVEEALCYGWIDSTMKKLDAFSTVQRFTPRRKNSALSVLNRIRVRKMIELGKMTQAGLQSISQHIHYSDDGNIEVNPFVMPPDIIARLKKNAVIWNNFESYPEHYKQIRIGFIEGAREYPDEFEKRLRFFMKKTYHNKKYGSMPMALEEETGLLGKDGSYSEKYG